MRHIRLILILILIFVFSSCNSNNQTVQETENNTVNDNKKGAFTVTFFNGYDNHVIFNDEVKIEGVSDEFIPIFVNGVLSKCMTAFSEGDFLYVPSDFAEKYLDTTIELSSEDSIMRNDETYYNLFDAIENTSWDLQYVKKDAEDIEGKTLIVTHDCVYLYDNIMTAEFSSEEGLEIAKSTSKESLELFEVSLKDNLKNSNEDTTRFDDELAQIRQDISTMIYIGETLGYYIYDMNVYRVMVDKHTGQPYFNYESGLATYNVVLDPESPENYKMFMPLYIVG